MEQYNYTPVEAGSIRFLHIISVSPDVILRVEHASLDDNPTYNALSYTWGPPTFTERAILEKDGQRGYLNITPSLRHCLSHFEQYVGSNIWIDALCINQRDNAEKSLQVRQMDRVYDQATKVLMWLGPSSEDSDDAIKAMATYGRTAVEAGILKMRKDQWSTQLNGRLTESSEEEKKKEESGDAGASTVSALLRLVRKASEAAIDETRAAERLPRAALARLTHRDYFTRVWIKQEITLARDPVIHCGAYSAPLAHFHGLVLLYGLLPLWESAQYGAGLSSTVPMPELKSVGGGGKTVLEIELDDKRLHLVLTPATNDAIGYQLSGRRKRQEESPEPLHTLLHQSYVRSSDDKPPLACFMPEDKIWGLSGIAGDMESLGLQANYGVDSADQVYENTARALLKQGRVDILKWCRPRKGGAIEERQGPSWVPNWRLPIHEPWSEDAGEPIFKPFRQDMVDQGHQAELVELSSRPGCIGLPGILVDTVTEVGLLWHADEDAKFSQVSFLKMAQELLNYLNQTSHYTEPDRMEALWRIPIGDKEFFPTDHPYFVRGTERSREQFHLIISRPWDSEMTKLSASYQACATRQFNARPVRTEQGWVGMGPGQVLVGDVIVFLVGATVPFVLRPKELEEGKTGYLVVGECFMHGMMDGQLEGSGELTLFELH